MIGLNAKGTDMTVGNDAAALTWVWSGLRTSRISLILIFDPSIEIHCNLRGTGEPFLPVSMPPSLGWHSSRSG